MILQALVEYYERKAKSSRGKMAPEGFEYKEIPYVVILNQRGNPVSLNSTYEGEGRARRAKKYLVPATVKKTSGVAANLFWDTPEYTLGIVVRSPRDRVKKMHKAFKERLGSLNVSGSKGIRALMAFLDSPGKASKLKAFGESFKRLKDDKAALVSFQLRGSDDLICEEKEIMNAVEVCLAGEGAKGRCLVTGKKEEIESKTHPSIKGVWGAQTSGANIISYNLDAFRSFGKEQGANAPIGKKAVFAYTTALNHLLAKDSKQRIQVGDASTVFWSAKNSGKDFESSFGLFFGFSKNDDPDKRVQEVRELYESLKSGVYTGKRDEGFYVLGLSPNAARLAVRFWYAGSIAEAAEKIRLHFEDIEIIRNPKDPEVIPLFKLLVSTAVQEKAENIQPNLAGDTMRSVLSGLPYPSTLLQGVLRRIKAEHRITRPRAAIIKGCINRLARYKNKNEKEVLKVSLDKTNLNAGYRLGRLFAVLEKIQQEANPGINATISDRFYGSASGSPVIVFGNLMRLSRHHLAKLHPGQKVNMDRLIGEIMSGLPGFPSHLNLEEQGYFAVGYYHQRQDFFTPKNNSDKEE